MPTNAEVVARARVIWPALVSSSNAILEAWAEWAQAMVGTVWGDRQLLGQALLLCHAMAAVDPQGDLGSGGGASTAGAVSNLSTSRMSVGYGGGGPMSSYAAPSDADAQLATTTYGRQYLALRNVIVGGPRTIVPGR